MRVENGPAAVIGNESRKEATVLVIYRLNGKVTVSRVIRKSEDLPDCIKVSIGNNFRVPDLVTGVF